MSKLGKIRKLSGSANPNYGKAWGNALGGYKSQPRVGGKFATSSQLKAALKGQGTVSVVSTPAELNRLHREIGNEGKSAMNKKLTIAGGMTALGIIALLNPSVSLSRKRASVSVRPRKKVGPLHIFSSHSFGIEREGDDAIDRGVRGTQDWASKKVRTRIGGGTGADLFDAAIGKSGSVTIAGRKAEVDGTGLNRRIRFQSGGNKSVPGAPATKGGKSTRPQGGKKGGAKTITNSVKGGSGAVRPERRGNGKKKSKKNKSKKRTYTK